MLNHNSVDAVPMADADHVSERQHPAETETDISPEEVQLFKTLSRKHDVAPIAYMPRALAASARSRNLRRVLTREQGRALEMIGHAVDYLNDCYLFEGRRRGADQYWRIRQPGDSDPDLAALADPAIRTDPRTTNIAPMERTVPSSHQ